MIDTNIKKEVIDNYRNLLINMETNSIDSATLGFVEADSCSPALFSILVHCIENINIFNDSQLNNINNFINKLSYGK